MDKLAYTPPVETLGDDLEDTAKETTREFH